MKLTAFCLLAVVSVASANADLLHDDYRTANRESISQGQLIAVVLRVLETAGRSGSLEYEGVCTMSGGINDPFKAAVPRRDSPPLQALRRAFAGESAVTAREDAAGFIRVVGGDVRTDLLNLKIHEIAFRDEAEPWEAVYKLLAMPEVQAYTQAHHITFIMTPVGMVPPRSGRLLNVTLKNDTLSQALDEIAEVFPGVWIYGECTTNRDQRHVYIVFHEFSSESK